MSEERTTDLATLRFAGHRFDGHALDVDCTRELVAYRTLVLECAKELWKRRYPDRGRLPNRFDAGFRIVFDRVEPGSAVLPLLRVREIPQHELDFDDEFDEAAHLIDQAIAAADRDELLPEDFPSNVVPLFRDFGASLRSEETLFVRSRRSATEAAYGEQARQRLSEWAPNSYEDKVDVTGEVRMANVGPGAFKLQLPAGGSMVEGRFEAAHEALVLQALKDHQQARLRVVGLGEFASRDRQLRRMLRIDAVEVMPLQTIMFDASARPIWEELADIGHAAADGTWDLVPNDLSTRIDEVVYGRQGDAH